MDTFVICSAINSKSGSFSFDQRFQQTLNTIQSIKNKTNSKIVLLDSSLIPLTEEQRNIILQSVDVFVDYSNSPSIQKIYQIYIGDMIKSLCELFCLQDFLKQAKERNFLSGNVYKITGRQELTDDFQPFNFKDKIVLLEKENGTKFFDKVTNEYIKGYIEYQYKPVLWAFDSSLTDYTIQKLEIMFNDLIEIYDSKLYSDIEHMFYKHFDQEKIVEVSKLGIKGSHAASAETFIK